MRDENGFKQHTMSESHVRQMQLIGEDPKKYIRQYSVDFKRDFLTLLRTAHGEKPIHINKFYQEYISNKEHVHMNSTQWTSLTEFAKYLGREGIVRVTEDEKGVYISWIDNSPEALRRQDAIKKKERQDRGDEEREKKAIQEQVERAHRAAIKEDEEQDDLMRILERKEGEKISLNFGAKPKGERNQNAPEPTGDAIQISIEDNSQTERKSIDSAPAVSAPDSSISVAPQPKVKMSFGSGSIKPKNVFAAAKKNPLAAKKSAVMEPPKKMSEAERIMRDEIDRKRRLEEQGGNGGKKPRTGVLP
jgi:DNA/RNA-binding protein KIN17